LLDLIEVRRGPGAHPPHRERRRQSAAKFRLFARDGATGLAPLVPIRVVGSAVSAGVGRACPRSIASALTRHGSDVAAPDEGRSAPDDGFRALTSEALTDRSGGKGPKRSRTAPCVFYRGPRRSAGRRLRGRRRRARTFPCRLKPVLVGANRHAEQPNPTHGSDRRRAGSRPRSEHHRAHVGRDRRSSQSGAGLEVLVARNLQRVVRSSNPARRSPSPRDRRADTISASHSDRTRAIARVRSPTAPSLSPPARDDPLAVYVVAIAA